MATNYIRPGNTRTWTNAGTAVSSGDVVRIGQQIGVALVDIAQNASGEVAMEGNFRVPKVSAAVIANGEMVIWDSSEVGFEDNAATPATGDVSGAVVAAEAAGAGATSIEVNLANRIGTVA